MSTTNHGRTSTRRPISLADMRDAAQEWSRRNRRQSTLSFTFIAEENGDQNLDLRLWLQGEQQFGPHRVLKSSNPGEILTELQADLPRGELSLALSDGVVTAEVPVELALSRLCDIHVGPDCLWRFGPPTAVLDVTLADVVPPVARWEFDDDGERLEAEAQLVDIYRDGEAVLARYKVSLAKRSNFGD